MRGRRSLANVLIEEYIRRYLKDRGAYFLAKIFMRNGSLYVYIPLPVLVFLRMHGGYKVIVDYPRIILVPSDDGKLKSQVFSLSKIGKELVLKIGYYPIYWDSSVNCFIIDLTRYLGLSYMSYYKLLAHAELDEKYLDFVDSFNIEYRGIKEENIILDDFF